MRTTIDIDEDVIIAVKEMVRVEGTSIGKLLSRLVRQTLTQGVKTAELNGLPLFSRQPGAGVVTLELVNQLRDEALYKEACS